MRRPVNLRTRPHPSMTDRRAWCGQSVRYRPRSPGRRTIRARGPAVPCGRSTLLSRWRHLLNEQRAGEGTLTPKFRPSCVPSRFENAPENPQERFCFGLMTGFVNSFADGGLVGCSRRQQRGDRARSRKRFSSTISGFSSSSWKRPRPQSRKSLLPVTIPAYQSATGVGVGVQLAGHPQGRGTRVGEAPVPRVRFRRGGPIGSRSDSKLELTPALFPLGHCVCPAPRTGR